MKKSRLFTAGALALALVLGVVLAGCGDESTAAKVTVIFNKNGADGNAPAEKTVDKGSRITIPGEGNLYLSGSSFKGWNTRRDGSGDLYYEGDRMAVNDDITLYAQWGQGGNPNPNNPDPNNPNPNNPDPNNPNPNNPDPNNPDPNNPDPGGNNGVPSAPTGVTATAQSSSSIKVTWNNVSGATSYDVYYEIGFSSTRNFADNVSGTSYTHTGLEADTTYWYYIKAKNSAGESGYSSFAYTDTEKASSGGGGGTGTIIIQNLSNEYHLHRVIITNTATNVDWYDYTAIIPAGYQETIRNVPAGSYKVALVYDAGPFRSETSTFTLSANQTRTVRGNIGTSTVQ